MVRLIIVRVGSVERGESCDETTSEELAKEETASEDSEVWVTGADTELLGKMLEEDNSSEVSVATEDCSTALLELIPADAPDAVLDSTLESALGVLLVRTSIVELGTTSVD